MPYSSYKPGQTSLDRDYYSKINGETPSGNTYLENFQRFESTYTQNLSKTVKPDDYKNNAKPIYLLENYEIAHAPELKNYSKTHERNTNTNNNSLFR